MVETLSAAPKTRQIRVFLSSTFRDFMEERDLLVKQVFPALRRRAQERGVEVVDVDLRWGITEEESQQGKVIGICLAEIERCRPYFIGMLGERYGWTPQPGDYPDELFEREPLQWIRDHQGGASVTELEILHGVLNDREMAGRAFFYFRDPDWSEAQSEPGFVCDTEEEQQKLTHLKQRIRSSGFPVAENLADPQAIADQIEADLWALIEELYPELDQADALEREARKHAGYRQSRLGVYLGGEGYIQQLEQMIQAGESKILITGNSGAGKSALIANWLAAHQEAHPNYVVHAHHLGCSNDANAIRPLLARMLDTSSRLLLEHELIFEPIQVPQDWWELTAKVAGTLQDLGRWCRNTGNRWIWVLDGLDRLDADDQQALPWLPLLIPEGVSVVISALECNARSILEERQFRTLTIGPLQRPEQEALIERYLERYTKKLEPERRQQILNCRLATSPLFLKVLLEELRQCGRYETLKEQIEGYIKPKEDGSLAVSDLYERVLERLEGDCGVEVVSKLMSTLWAGREGLTETELLAITNLAPRQWAPIDLAMSESFCRNGNRLTFDNEYLGRAVRLRYCSRAEEQSIISKAIAEWIFLKGEWNERDAREMPWQWMQAGCTMELLDHLSNPFHVAFLNQALGSIETLELCRFVGDEKGSIEAFLGLSIIDDIEQGLAMPDRPIGGQLAMIYDQDNPSFGDLLTKHATELTWMLGQLVSLIVKSGIHRGMLRRLSTALFQVESQAQAVGHDMPMASILMYAHTHYLLGKYNKSIELLESECSRYEKESLGSLDKERISLLEMLGSYYCEVGRFAEAKKCLEKCLRLLRQSLGLNHPKTLSILRQLGIFELKRGSFSRAAKRLRSCLGMQEQVLGKSHPESLETAYQLGGALMYTDCKSESEPILCHCFYGRLALLSAKHPETYSAAARLTLYYSLIGEQRKLEEIYDLQYEYGMGYDLLDREPSLVTLKAIYDEGLAWMNGPSDSLWRANNLLLICKKAFDKQLEPLHPNALLVTSALGVLSSKERNTEKAVQIFQYLSGLTNVEYPDMLSASLSISEALADSGCYEQAITCYEHCLARQENEHGVRDERTIETVSVLAGLYSIQGRYEEAISMGYRSLGWFRDELEDCHVITIAEANRLALHLRKAQRYSESERCYRESLKMSEKSLGPDHYEIGMALIGLAQTLEKMSKNEEASAIRDRHKRYKALVQSQFRRGNSDRPYDAPSPP